LFFSQRGIVIIKAINSSFRILKDILYILGLGISLISIRRLYKNSLKGSFNLKNIYFYKNNKLVIYI